MDTLWPMLGILGIIMVLAGIALGIEDHRLRKEQRATDLQMLKLLREEAEVTRYSDSQEPVRRRYSLQPKGGGRDMKT